MGVPVPPEHLMRRELRVGKHWHVVGMSPVIGYSGQIIRKKKHCERSNTTFMKVGWIGI